MTSCGNAVRPVWRAGCVTLLTLAAIAWTSTSNGQPAEGDVDLSTSRVYVLVGKTGFGHDHAVIGSLQSGRLQLGVDERAGTLVFDMRTFRADTPEARKLLGLAGETDQGTRRQVDDNMLGPAVLDVATHPTATFDVRSSKPSARRPTNGKTAYELVGAFTLHGVTRPVTIHVEAEALGPVVRLWGGFAIKQTAFGMKPFAKFGGVVGVADELKIYGDIRLVAGTTP